MEFMLKMDGQGQLRLPVGPPEFTIQSGNMNQSVTVVRRGELNLWGPEMLEGITLQTFFPLHYTPGLCSYDGFPAPWDCVKMIDDWRNSGKPLRIIIVDRKLNVDINMEVLIESFDKGMKDATGDVYFTLVLKRYKKITIPDAPILQQPTVTRNTPTSKLPPANGAQKSYTVVKGDTLWGIAKKHYGNGSQWPKIHNANKDKIKDPNKIYPGQVFIIP